MLTRRQFVAGAAAAPLALAQAQDSKIETFFLDFANRWMRGNPEGATAARYFTGDVQDELERQLTPQTRERRAQRIALAREGLQQLRTFDPAEMTEIQRLARDTMEWQLDILVRGEQFLDYDYPFQQMNGINVGLVEYFTVRRPMVRLRDAENYVAALGQVLARMNEGREEAERLQQQGIIPPRFILNATIKQMRSFIDPAPASNPFLSTFREKVAAIAGIPEARRDAMLNEAHRIVRDQVYPGFGRAIELLESQLPLSKDDAGLWRFRGGNEAYAFFLEQFTTTKMTADQIHSLGLEQVAKIEAQMDQHLRALGRRDGSVKERVEKLKLDLQYPDPTGEASREKIIRDLDAMIREAERRAALLFDIKPKAPVEVRPFPTFREANAAANYNAPSPDGSRPGVFQFPRRIENMTSFRLRSLVHHETVPGHHFHIALQVENTELPRFMQLRTLGGISAITEGWGLYAERLAVEENWYDGDTEGLLGALDSELFRARRLVVDTGIHSKAWTRQQAIDYGIEASEVERYSVYPGQACSYMIGQLKIIELCEKARVALGDKFNLRDYHTLVLRAGSVPLPILERQVESFIERVRL